MKSTVKDVTSFQILVDFVTKLRFAMTEVQILRLCCKLQRFEHLEMEQNGVRGCRVVNDKGLSTSR